MRNDWCDFNDASIVVTGKVTATDPYLADDNINYDKTIALKNSAPFFNCTLKINSQLIEDTQNLDIVMSMYNSVYYSKNSRKATGSLWKYYPDMPGSEDVKNNERTKIIYPISSNYSQNFDYKTKLVGKLPDGEDELEDIKIVVPLRYFSNLFKEYV